MAPDETAVSLSPTPDGDGYRVFTSKGRVVTFGTAAHLGDMSGVELAGPVVDAGTTATGEGYYMLGSEGGIFTFGDAAFYGSIQSVVNDLLGPGNPAADWLTEPIVGIGPTATGRGYWLVAADGGMFAFGDAVFHGSIPGVLGPGTGLDQPIVGLVPHAEGYLMVARDGGIFSFGTSQFHGSIPGLLGSEPELQSQIDVVNVSVLDDRSGYVMVEGDGRSWAFGDASATVGGLGPIDVSLPPHPGDFFDCADFATTAAAQRWFDKYRPFYGDPAGLDDDGDGTACEADLTPADAGFTVAFVGNSGVGSGSADVMSLIADRSPDLLVHLGGFDGVGSPTLFTTWLDTHLGAGFPVLAVPGDADAARWDDYSQLFEGRLADMPRAVCTGDYGIDGVCTVGGVRFVMSGVGTVGDGHDQAIASALEAAPTMWRLCIWNKNQRTLQVAGKVGEVGWAPYEACREAGALVVNANSANYSRTKTLNNIGAKLVDPEWADPSSIRVAPGSTAVIVSGLGGARHNPQTRCLPETPPYGCSGEWASISSSKNGANFGALFVEFGVDGDPRLASGEFVDIDGDVVDSFTVVNQNGLQP